MQVSVRACATAHSKCACVCGPSAARGHDTCRVVCVCAHVCKAQMCGRAERCLAAGPAPRLPEAESVTRPLRPQPSPSLPLCPENRARGGAREQAERRCCPSSPAPRSECPPPTPLPCASRCICWCLFSCSLARIDMIVGPPPPSTPRHKKYPTKGPTAPPRESPQYSPRSGCQPRPPCVCGMAGPLRPRPHDGSTCPAPPDGTEQRQGEGRAPWAPGGLRGDIPRDVCLGCGRGGTRPQGQLRSEPRGPPRGGADLGCSVDLSGSCCFSCL